MRSTFLTKFYVYNAVLLTTDSEIEQMSRAYLSCTDETYVGFSNTVHISGDVNDSYLLFIGCRLQEMDPFEYLDCNAFSEIYKVLLPLTCMSICVFYNKEGDYSSFTTILIAYRKAQDTLSGVELFTISRLLFLLLK